MPGDEPRQVTGSQGSATAEPPVADGSIDELNADELSEGISQLHAVIVAALKRLLDFVAAYDRCEAWRADGAASMVDWLVMRLSVERRTAAEWVRVAHRLDDLPAIAAALAEGRLSWDQLAPLTRFATEENDRQLAGEAPGWSANETREAAQRATAPTVRDAEEAHRARSLRFFTDRHLWHVRGALPLEDGALVASVLSGLASEAPADPGTGRFEPLEARLADALVELATTKAAEESDADRPSVIVHTDVSALAGDEAGLAELDSGARLAAETARRLACDCRWQLVVEDGRGEVVRLGRTTRQVPAWLVRQLRRRDRGCRFPGCGRVRWLHAHHLVHWADGGSTDQDNLLLLCGHHHRVLHEGGWSVHVDESGAVTFKKPSGRLLTKGPPPLRPDVRRRLFGPAPPRPPSEPLPPDEWARAWMQGRL